MVAWPRGIREIVDSEWVPVTHVITVLTGRNKVGKTSEMATLRTLLQSVISVRCANPIGAMMESFRGPPAQIGLIRHAHSAPTSTGPVVSWLHRG